MYLLSCGNLRTLCVLFCMRKSLLRLAPQDTPCTRECEHLFVVLSAVCLPWWLLTDFARTQPAPRKTSGVCASGAHANTGGRTGDCQASGERPGQFNWQYTLYKCYNPGCPNGKELRLRRSAEVQPEFDSPSRKTKFFYKHSSKLTLVRVSVLWREGRRAASWRTTCF